MLGGWTSANYAALVCTELPICQGDWFNQFQIDAFSVFMPEAQSYEYGVLDYASRVSIHISHRIGAMLTSLVLLVYFIYLISSACPLNKKIAWLGIGLLCSQVGLGISNIVFSLPIGVAVAHNLNALLLLVTLITSVYVLSLQASMTDLKENEDVKSN
jgi:cytochrome c oxidase assembly protein subunit 15